MGCNIVADNSTPKGDLPVWQAWRDQFPVTRELVYLNHAAVAPLAKPAADAMARLAQDVLCFGSAHHAQWVETYAGLRAAAARLLGAEREEIALVKNTSEGLSMVANGFPWRPGDKVVGFQEEFPANVFPWKRLEARGVRSEWLSITDPPERIEAACRGARLLAASFVQYLSGYRLDIERVGEICCAHNCIFVLDAIQGLGAFPLDVLRAGVHALAADGHKWLLGPEGCGILYVRKDLQEMIDPVEFGWTNVARFSDYGSRDMTLRPDACRYECGTLNTIGCYGLRAAIEFLLSVGIPRIAAQVDSLADRIATGAAARGYDLMAARTAETGSGIVSIRKPGLDARLAVNQLVGRGIIVAPRQGWIRVSPHFYISPEDIDKLLEALP